MLAAKLKEFLSSRGVPYELISHSTTYTAQKTAENLHLRGEELAKSVIVKMDGAFALAVLPTSRHADLSALQSATGARAIRLASEIEFKDRFPDCEIGAIPPFGNLYGLPVFVEEELSKSEGITFNAGSHTELIRMSYQNFQQLVRPTVVKFASRKPHPHAAAMEDRVW
jgi:Ala-tRNA(Pro) deacylase